MASQKDLFNDSESVIDSRACISLPVTSSIDYRWLIIFNWSGKINFKVVERSSCKEIKDEWVSGQLKPSSRAKKLSLSAFKKQSVSLFGKIYASK